jgi:multidrug transporter EmrE-like cation transporter
MKLYLAAIAGLFAATGGLFAKLSTGEAIWIDRVCHYFSSSSDVCSVIKYGLRASMFVLMLLVNSFGTGFQMSAMAATSSGIATVINTGSNLIVTALYGMMIFNEQLSIQWYIGATFIAVGISIISTVDSAEQKLVTSDGIRKSDRKNKKKQK